MKLQNLTVVFIIIILPIILLVSFYISTGLKTINYQAKYDTALLNATHDAIYAFEINTARDKHSENAEVKRDILKSSVKMFEKSLCNSCNISVHEINEIEKHIPALVFCMYDGFYMYAPSYVAATEKYEHNLKNYVYYSESFDDGTVITYTLDNYVTVFSDKGIRSGYLIDRSKLDINGEIIKYNDVTIDTTKSKAKKYYEEAKRFTNWFLDEIKMHEKEKTVEENKQQATYLNIGVNNDPEDPNSAFVQHKRTVMKEKIESVLNSSITVYSDRTLGHTYKMPKLTEEDWGKIYNNISIISFFQGKEVGLTTYNGYCVLNSTNSNEYVNPNLMYFIDNGYYHDIRCSTITGISSYISGFKIGDFQMKNEDGTYKYQHDEFACYECINGQVGSNETVREYINSAETKDEIKTSYWTSLAIERYRKIKLIKDKVARWVQEGTNIYGETEDGSRLVTLNIGDYINYDCTNGGTEYTYTSEEKNNGIRDQEFKTENTIKWRVIGVEEECLIIVPSAFVGDLTLKEVNGGNRYDTFISELREISKIYGNGKGASYARHITTEDVINLCNAYGKNSLEEIAGCETKAIGDYGNGNDIFSIYVTKDNEDPSDKAEKSDIYKGKLTKCDDVFVDILFPATEDKKGMWLANKFSIGGNNQGLYNTYGEEEYKVLYASFLNSHWDSGREYGVRPVVKLEKDIEVKNVGTAVDGCTQWEIK